MKNVLIIGGSSGLGLELAKIYSNEHKVIITGREKKESIEYDFVSFDMDKYESTEGYLENFLGQLPQIDILIYALGYYQKGVITDISDDDIKMITDSGITVPSLIVKKILIKQGILDTFIAITSTSAWTPRLLEPLYATSKAGLTMLAASLSLDDRIDKVMVAGPAGMKTPFWKNNPEVDTSEMLEPHWVAENIFRELHEDFKYKYIQLLRKPERVVLVEKR
ncbi:MAG: SDR family oxidoreductase [Candidatus Paceibacterota bacterium]